MGRYELVERLGDGGMAEVHLARRLGVLPFQRPIAVVKKIHAALARNQQFIDLLLDEARVSALIKHPRVIDMYDVGVSRGVYFIATEHLSGQPLSALLARCRETGRGTGTFLDVYSTARIIADAADGLHAAHELRSLTGRPIEMVHRDVTPKNIMVLYDGSVKLVDVGVARAWAAVPARDRATGYLAPEQLDRGTIDRRTDIFSLGVVMWEALAGTRLFTTGSPAALLRQIKRGELRPPSTHRPEVPDALDKICMRALAADPGERFQTASEMCATLESLLDDTSFRRTSGGVAAFMGDVFAAERLAHQEQVERASEVVLQRDAERRPPAAGRQAHEGESSDTLVRMPEELPGPVMALGSQQTPLPAPPAPEARPLVPRPEPLPRDVAAARRRASAALAAVARAAPLPAGGSVPGSGAATNSTPAVAPSESPMDPGNGVPPTDSTVPGARSSGAAAEGGATAAAPSGTSGLFRGITSSGSSESSSRPRGKGRPGRIDSIGDSWTDRRQQAGGRSLPLPAPPKVALGTHSDALITGVGAEVEEDDDDFTFVDPDRSPRSFESGAMSALKADRTGTSRALVVTDESIKPILTGHRSRRIWTAAFVALGATGVVSALVYTALGGGDRRLAGSRGEGAILSPEAQGPLFDTAPPVPQAGESPAPESSAAAGSSVAAGSSAAAGSKFVAAPPRTGTRPPVSGGDAGKRASPPSPPSLPSPPASSTRRAPSTPVPPSRPAPSRAAPLPRIPSQPRVAAAPSATKDDSDTRAESRRRTRPPPAREPSRPEPVANPDDLYRDGARLYLDGKLDEARRKFQTAIDSAPRFAPAHRGLGLVYERMGQNGRAIRSWQAYLRIAPEAADAELVRARIERLSR